MRAEELWKAYCEKENIDIDTPYKAWGFGDAPDQLADLVLTGIKTATASAYDLYFMEGEEDPLPQSGDYSIILNSKDEAVCVIQTTKTSKENNQVVSEKIEGVYVSKLLCSKDMLFAFATTKYGKEMNSYIYIYDAEELSFDEKIDITNYGGTHYKAILFDNNILFSNSVDSGDHPCNTVCIYSINDKTIETISFDQYYPLDLAVWDNILIVSHFDLVKREGGSISIYNLETKELNNIELGHDVEQMTINENVIYILSDKIIYQYELKDMNLYLKCKTQIKKSNEENYLSGIFYIKPESMKFTL